MFPVSTEVRRYVLEKVIDERTVSAADVRRHLAGMWAEMSALEKRVAELRGMLGSVHPVRRVKKVVQRVDDRLPGLSHVVVREAVQDQHDHCEIAMITSVGFLFLFLVLWEFYSTVYRFRQRRTSSRSKN